MVPYGRQPGPYFHGLLAQPDCGNCPLKYDTKVFPDGPMPARIVFVGEEPGNQEKMDGRGFGGPSGQLLWHMAREVGLDRSEVWTTNAALCKARQVRLTTGGVIPHMVVKALAAQACRARLVQEMRGVNPAVIVPLGNWALWALSDIPKAKIYSYRGSRIDVDLDGLYDAIVQGKLNAPIRQIKAA